MRVLCVTHYLGDVLGSMGEVLRNRNYEIEIVRADKGSVTGIDPLAHDIAIIMGGPMGVYQDNLFPWIRDEIAYAKARMENDRPLLGICLGSQLMAAALGSTVYKGEQGAELGWHRLTLQDEAGNTPLRHFDPALTSMFHWHGDTYALPAGAKLLASTDKYKMQAFGYGKNALGLQFHPEMTRAVVEEWLMQGDFYHVEKSIGPLHEFRAQMDDNGGTLRLQAQKFMNEWLDGLTGE